MFKYRDIYYRNRENTSDEPMRIHIATFAFFPEQIFIAEKNFSAEKLILILSEENIDPQKKDNEDFILKINEVSDFYQKMNIPVEKIYVYYKNFMEMTLVLAKMMSKFKVGDNILLNFSGGRRSIPISLIYAGTFISNFKDINIKCVVIPEDRTYKPFNLLPNYLPDEIDIKLMSKFSPESTLKSSPSISKKKTLNELEEYLGIKQPTISMRIKRLESHNYIAVKGRERKLLDLGKMLVDINRDILNGKN